MLPKMVTNDNKVVTCSQFVTILLSFLFRCYHFVIIFGLLPFLITCYHFITTLLPFFGNLLSLCYHLPFTFHTFLFTFHMTHARPFVRLASHSHLHSLPMICSLLHARVCVHLVLFTPFCLHSTAT